MIGAFGKGLSAVRRRIFLAGAKVGLPTNSYFVLTKADAALINSKLHPNTGTPNFDIKHEASDISNLTYANISTQDGSTNVTGAELEELTNGSTTTLHNHVIAPAGLDTQIQLNVAGVLGADTELVYNINTNTLQTPIIKIGRFASPLRFFTIDSDQKTVTMDAVGSWQIYSPAGLTIKSGSGGTNFDGTIFPTNVGDDLGISSAKWRTLYLGGQMISSLATGTAPLSVSSITLVTNLNADLLDGKNTGTSGNAIPLLDGVNTWSGTQTMGTTTKWLFTDENASIHASSSGTLVVRGATQTQIGDAGNIVLGVAGTTATITIVDEADLAFGTTTGTRIGTATNQKIGFWGKTAVIQQTDGAALTNSVTAGGTTDTIADFTDLTTYSNSAAAIRNDIYQLARKLKIVDDALRLYGLLS